MVAQLREANENLVFATINAQSLRDDAEAANRRQNEFLAMLAHELRNPLAPISMAAALLERIPAATPQLLNLTQVIGRQVDHMAHLLDDLLDAARISSGKITLTIAAGVAGRRAGAGGRNGRAAHRGAQPAAVRRHSGQPI